MDNKKPAENEEEPKEEKKNGISGFFKKIGDKFNDATYDIRAESDYNKKHGKYVVYTGAGVLSHTAELYADESVSAEGKFIVAPSSDEEIKSGHIIVNDKTDEAFYISSVSSTKVYIDFEGKMSEKPALKIVFGEPAEKVDVIKVGDNYYLKK